MPQRSFAAERINAEEVEMYVSTCWRFSLKLLAAFWLCYALIAPAQQKNHDAEKMLARQQFSKNFRDLQVLSQALLREHESGQLTASRLGKEAKSIQKCAKTLRTLMALGELAKTPDEVDKQLDSAQEFDQSIRRLAKMIKDFAHNPIHQNSKVFHTVEATKAQTDLLTIITLAKVIESQAKNYQAAQMVAR
jgi:hypothetical protein